ncbi:gliding motility lipoprotein GldH [Bacteroides reticulotermitis]|uniref:GldH protein n=2 Tax=Bacteroides reticulotermitis TaxID=1133319 RepID=W4UZP1_9BACE|nr:gliding motility lipoprotein GldH [Bacteroides reticulotermitis]MBB4046105.1 gliding motility-associated lipoprotein GldH [Bacteroides reticulotermitis]GAE85939.1 GldH protein [Bacteroides reticulotermitis JCM 10512]
MRSLLKNSLFYLFCICFSTACIEKNTVYHSYQSLSQTGWGKSDTLFFQVMLNDSVPTLLNLFAEVRNQNSYPYQDLYLFVSQNLRDSLIWETDTIEIALTDKAGRWKGNEWGSLHQSTVPIRSVIVSHTGKRTIKVAHGMKDFRLSGLNDVGIRIDR